MKNVVPGNSSIINVCIIPNAKVGKNCVELSQSLKSDGTLFVLDGKEKFAHMTVYMARFADSEIPKVIATAKKALQEAKGFQCTHIGYYVTPGSYLEVSYRKSDEFMALHRLVMDNLKDFRLNPGLPHEEGYFAPYNSQQRINAQANGYDLSEDLYRPHITLTRYKEFQMPKTFPGFPPTELSFSLNKICIYRADDNGAVYEKLAEFPVG